MIMLLVLSNGDRFFQFPRDKYIIQNNYEYPLPSSKREGKIQVEVKWLVTARYMPLKLFSYFMTFA